VATEVELLPILVFDENADVEYEGFIDRFVSLTDFDVAGQRITTTGTTTYVNGTANSVAANVKVEVEGTIDAIGRIVADRIIVKPTDAIRVEGTVSGVDITPGAMTISTDVGLTFAVRALTELEDDRSGALSGSITLDQIGMGDFVEIRGFLDGFTLVAAEVELEDFDPRTEMRGPVTADDEIDTVDILDISITGVGGVTEYQDINDVTITQAAFHGLVEIGTFVEVRWDNWDNATGTSATPDQLSLEEDDD
jgi:hypothetical protein